MNCTLDSFKPYQRTKLSDGGHKTLRQQSQRDADVRWRCSDLLGLVESKSTNKKLLILHSH